MTKHLGHSERELHIKIVSLDIYNIFLKFFERQLLLGLPLHQIFNKQKNESIDLRYPVLFLIKPEFTEIFQIMLFLTFVKLFKLDIRCGR